MDQSVVKSVLVKKELVITWVDVKVVSIPMSFTLDVDLFIHQCLCFFLGVIKNGSLVGGQMHALNTLSDFFYIQVCSL